LPAVAAVTYFLAITALSCQRVITPKVLPGAAAGSRVYGSHKGRWPGEATCHCFPVATSITHTEMTISGPLSGNL
jgi:hypothetical protein